MSKFIQYFMGYGVFTICLLLIIINYVLTPTSDPPSSLSFVFFDRLGMFILTVVTMVSSMFFGIIWTLDDIDIKRRRAQKALDDYYDKLCNVYSVISDFSKSGKPIDTAVTEVIDKAKRILE